MSTCSNCYNGCTEIVSDRCVKYTGVDVPALGITNGDTLLSIEETIFNYIQSFILGEEIFPTLDPSILCKIINDNLPICSGCTGISLNDILTAIIKSVCDLETEIANINGELDILNADYTIGCLTGVTASSDTHAILQAVINNLCTLNSAVSAIVLDLTTNYVTYLELDDLIQAYLDGLSSGLYSSRMIPYAVVPYFGPITFFNSSGAGTGDWANIYLCNGNNGTPDLRGRSLTGVINGVPGPTMSPVVDPAVSAANPNYSIFDNAGANQISLLSTQIPSHTHPSTATVIETPHLHQVGPAGVGVLGPKVSGTTTVAFDNTNDYDMQSTFFTELASTGITVTLNNAAGPVGGGLPHANIHPVTACYYIQYRP
jgi:microcystin-dependent protein